jgi:mannose/fructose/N-acetylgalactosamine-specific phosphotransferase system component IID
MHGKALDPTAMKGVGSRVFRRSFFLETLWNYAKMQNVGFLLCIYPALERLYSDEQEKKQAIFRQLDQVNTHPCMGPLLVGLVARLERDLELSSVMPYRRRVMSALAAHGDRFFWTHLKPLAAVWGVFLAVLASGSVAGCLVLLGIYNVPQLVVRWRGFDRGWQAGLKILEALKSPEMNVAILGMRGLLSLGLGLVAGILILAATKAPSVSSSISAPSVLGLGLVAIAATAVVVLRRGISLSLVLYLAALAAATMFMWFDTGMAFG